MKLNESSLTDKTYVQSVIKNLSNSEKLSWKKALKQCLNENPKLKKSVKFYKVLSGFEGLILVTALIIDAPFMLLMSAIPVIAGLIDEYTWKELKKCIRTKMGKGETPSNSISTSGDTQLKESNMKKTIRLTESELIDLVQKIIKEDEMSSDLSVNTPKGITLLQLGVNEPSYMISLKGYTPFYVNGKEQKKNIDIQPTDKLSSKDCMVEFVGNKSNKNFTLVFDNNGKASIRK